VTNYEKVREFHEAFGAAIGHPFPKIEADGWPKNEDVAVIELRMKLMYEELKEVSREFWDSEDEDEDTEISTTGEVLIPIDKQKLAKELADLLYVTYGTAITFGIPIDDVFAEVHRSNMSKLGADGKPIYREDGKVLKGPNYTPPDLSFVKTCCNTLGEC